MGVENSIEGKQLIWYGQVHHMAENKFPKKRIIWIPPGRK